MVKALVYGGAILRGPTAKVRGKRAKKKGPTFYPKVNANLEEALTFGEGPRLICNETLVFRGALMQRGRHHFWR